MRSDILFTPWSFLRVALLGMLLLSVVAFPAVATEKLAVEYTNAIGTQALEILTAKQTDAAKRERLEALFTKIVDTNWIARFVVGASWRKMSAVQQADYLATYRKFLVKHYTSNFADYTAGTNFKVVRVRPIGSDKMQYLVSVLIVRKGQQPVNLDYRIRQEGENNFHAIDILVEGVSLLATQRSEFASVIQRDGIEKLISLLKKKAV